jgi:hypothetical protein
MLINNVELEVLRTSVLLRSHCQLVYRIGVLAVGMVTVDEASVHDLSP